MTPTNESIKYLQNKGYIAENVEQKMRHYMNSKDLFGFIDIVAINPSIKGVLAVQSTSRSNTSHRIEKIFYDCKDKAIIWLTTGNRIEVQAWGGNNKGRRIEVYLNDGELMKRELSFEQDLTTSELTSVASLEPAASLDKPFAEGRFAEVIKEIKSV